MADKRYNISLGSDLDRSLTRTAAKLDVTKAEVMRRALMLFKHAVEADTVTLTKNGVGQNVLIK